MNELLLRRTSSALPVRIAAALLLSAASFGCGSGDSGSTTSSTPDASDGRYHPATDGVAMTEADACSALSSARQAKAKDLQCSATVRPCPTFLRAQFPGDDCVEYDHGSVQGCIAYYDAKTSCDDLAAAVTDCAVAPIAGSHSAGCQ
jgi:hypothetical protein